MFFYEFCEITKNTFFTEHLRTTAPGNREKVKGIKILCNSEIFPLTFMFDKVFKMDQVKFVKDSLYKIWKNVVCLSRPYPFKLFKGYLTQILLGPFLNTLSHAYI